MKSLLIIAVFAVFTKSGLAQNESTQNFLYDICNNNFDYHPHPEYCDKFIQCRYTNGNILIGEIQPCAFGSYWDQFYLTCVKAEEKNCETDMCRNEMDNTTFPSEKNCRGYWVCQNGKSVPICCPAGQKYNNSMGRCIDNEILHECNQTCLNDEYKFEMFENETATFDNETALENETTVANEVIVELCDKDVVPGYPSLYSLRIPGYPMPITMRCAPGTVFNSKSCNCTLASFKPAVQPMECKPEVFLTFDNTSFVMSGKTKHLHIADVNIEDGKAIFNGMSSIITIPRFSNVADLDTIVIKVNYTSEHNKTGIARAIVSNSGENCIIPSIMISEDSSNIYFGAGTTNPTRFGAFTVTNLTQEAPPTSGQMTRKSVTYKLKDDVLYGQSENDMAEKTARGSLLNKHCPLHVGFAKQLNRFEGELESLEIYLCDPDEM